MYLPPASITKDLGLFTAIGKNLPLGVRSEGVNQVTKSNQIEPTQVLSRDPGFQQDNEGRGGSIIETHVK